MFTISNFLCSHSAVKLSNEYLILDIVLFGYKNVHLVCVGNSMPLLKFYTFVSILNFFHHSSPN